jgi:cell fate (sporulation/competence/biofilm development) regulator YlbF (YheA/YmcA/DUF963 family)
MLKYVTEVSLLLATLERVEILDAAENIAEMILHSDTMEYYNKCLINIRNSEESQKKITAFTKMKEQYEEVQRFGKYHPDYMEIMKATRKLKREMDMDGNVAEFKKAENDLQGLLDEISLLIGRSVSEHIKVPTDNPFFEHSSDCGGSCGTGGCG